MGLSRAGAWWGAYITAPAALASWPRRTAGRISSAWGYAAISDAAARTAPSRRRPRRRVDKAANAGAHARTASLWCTPGPPTPTASRAAALSTTTLPRVPPGRGAAEAEALNAARVNELPVLAVARRPAGMSGTSPQGRSTSRLNKPAELRSPRTRDGERTIVSRRTFTRGGPKSWGQTERWQKTDSDFTQLLAAAPTTVFHELRHTMPEIAGERVDASGSRADATGMGKGLRRASGLDRPGQSSLPLLHRWRLSARRLP